MSERIALVNTARCLWCGNPSCDCTCQQRQSYVGGAVGNTGTPKPKSPYMGLPGEQPAGVANQSVGSLPGEVAAVANEKTRRVELKMGLPVMCLPGERQRVWPGVEELPQAMWGRGLHIAARVLPALHLPGGYKTPTWPDEPPVLPEGFFLSFAFRWGRPHYLHYI